MTSLVALFRLLTFSQVLLTLAAFVRGRNPKRAKAVLVGLCVGVLSYLILPMVPDGASIALVVVLTTSANAVPMFLWAACRLFFADDLSLPRSGLAAAGVALALVVVGELHAAPNGRPLGGLADVLVRWIPQMIKLGFALGAIHIALGGREMDLVEPRRRVRRWFALGLAIMIATVVLVEAVTAFRVPAWLEALGTAGMFCLALGLNSLLLSPNPAFELRLPPPPPRSVGGDPLLRELERLMQDERAYADHDLRIGGLARRVGTPEHRLRAAINGQLGYRNFNQYVNRYRVAEAARRLVSEPERSVISIALEVGFRSLSAFNKAFKELEGCTPSAYRQGPTISSNR